MPVIDFAKYESLLKRLKAKPITIEELARDHKCSMRTVYRFMDVMAEKGWLISALITKGQNRRYFVLAKGHFDDAPEVAHAR